MMCSTRPRSLPRTTRIDRNLVSRVLHATARGRKVPVAILELAAEALARECGLFPDDPRSAREEDVG